MSAGCYYRARRNDEAIAEFERGLKLDPTYVQAHMRLAGSYWYAGRHDEAIAERETVVRLSPGNLVNVVALEQAKMLAGRPNEFAERIAELIAGRPHDLCPAERDRERVVQCWPHRRRLRMAATRLRGAYEQHGLPRRGARLRRRSRRSSVQSADAGRRPAMSAESSLGAADITDLLQRWSAGERGALDHVLPLVYSELRKIAARQLRHDQAEHSIDPTDLVHALYLQLVDQRRATWANRTQFYAVVAQMMRRILVDHARARLADKRGAGTVTVSLASLQP